MRTLHEEPEIASTKMSVLCSFCVHHVAVNGEAVNSNNLTFWQVQRTNGCGNSFVLLCIMESLVRKEPGKKEPENKYSAQLQKEARRRMEAFL